MLKSLVIWVNIVVTASVTAIPLYSQTVLRSGSEVCKIKVKDAPRFNGYYIGQKRSSAFTDTSQLNMPIKVAGVQNSATATAENSARQITLSSWAGTIKSVTVHFIGYQPKGIESFVKGFSQMSNIKEEMFAINTDGEATLLCDGFAIHLSILQTDQEQYVIPMVRMERYVAKADIPKTDRPRGAPLDGELDNIRRDKAEFDKNPRKHVGGGRGPTVGP